MPNLQERLAKKAEKNFSEWNNSLQTKDPDRVASQSYAEDCTFLPTLSRDFKKGIKGAKEYFEHFLEKDPKGRIVKEEVQPICENAFVHSGFYDFEVGPPENRSVAEARFTFVWRKSKTGAWQIIHHHSSLKPDRE